MEEVPFQKVKTRRKRSHCPPGVPLTTIVCEDEFDCKEFESLFQNYNLKLEQTSTLKALAVLIFMSATLAVAELLSGPSLTISKGSHPVHCVIFVSLFIVTNVKYLQVTQLQQIVNLTLLFGFTFSFLCCPFSLGAMGMEPPTSPEQGMWQLILVTFVAYALLPVRTLLAVVLGIMVSISHLIVTATSVTVKTQKLWRTVRGVFFGGGGGGRGSREWIQEPRGSQHHPHARSSVVQVAARFSTEDSALGLDMLGFSLALVEYHPSLVVPQIW